jgi:hypothetical protein
MLAGILTPDRRAVTVNGIVPHVDRTGAIFRQRSQLWRDLPAPTTWDPGCQLFLREPAAVRQPPFFRLLIRRL